MKEVEKISIASVSFTVEKEAQSILKNYLDKLNSYYENESGKDEIISDIEERIVELLIERVGRENVVSIDAINSIIDLLGRPYLDDEVYNKSQNSSHKATKKIYRDIDNKILGGVCSGLAAYFNIDVVLIRVAYILLFVLAFFAGNHFSFYFNNTGFVIPISFFAYIVLCIIIPAARTVEQKCAMRGISPSVDQISSRVKNETRDSYRYRRDSTASEAGTLIGKFIKIIVGVLLVVIGLSSIVSGWMAFIGIEIFDKFFLPSHSLQFFEINTNIVWLKISGALCYFIPFIAMLYAGIMLLGGYKSPKWRPGLVMFLLWIVSIFTFITLSIAGAGHYIKRDRFHHNMLINKSYDTIYVKYNKVHGDNLLSNIEADENSFEMSSIMDGSDNFEVISYPDLRIIREEERDQALINYAGHIFPFAHNGIASYSLNYEHNNIITIQDSLITVKPTIISHNNKYQGITEKIRLYVPENTTVIMLEPINHTFEEIGGKVNEIEIKEHTFEIFN